MSVDHRVVLYVGKEFDGEYEAKEFYLTHIGATKAEENSIKEDGLEGLLSTKQIDGTLLNAYSGYNFVLGFDISHSVQNPDTFAEVVKNKILKWKELFGEETCEIINAVRVY